MAAPATSDAIPAKSGNCVPVFAKVCCDVELDELGLGEGLGVGATCPAHSPVDGAGDNVGVTLLVKYVVLGLEITAC